MGNEVGNEAHDEACDDHFVIVVSWNVLHRVHAVNWSEPAIRHWTDEESRIRSVADYLVATTADVVCLQEVSGDQLALLRDVEEGELFVTKHPRVPSFRRPTTESLRDAGEYLVTIVRDAGARLVRGEAFPTDGGKGFQRVELANRSTVINTHVSFGDKRTAQLARLATEAHQAPGLAILCGDFNADRDTCVTDLGSGWSAAVPLDGLHTRPRQTPSGKSQDIDHVFVHGGKALEAMVLDAEMRSDHNLLRARLRFPAVP
ncbi:MAG: endonuclease/exonuclease/phosphatase family protein [Kofleriaceae bacterium]